MTPGKLATELFDEISKIPGINSHSHLVPNNHTAIQPHGPIYLYAYSRLSCRMSYPCPVSEVPSQIELQFHNNTNSYN
jgi:hypothetical protein